MVYALREAHRVLRPQGLLIDLRPAAVHRRVGLVQDGEYKFKWFSRESFDDDREADRAVATMVNAGLLRSERRIRFACYRIMDSLEDFQAWMNNNIRKQRLLNREWLVQRLESAVDAADGSIRIVVSAPLILQVLRK